MFKAVIIDPASTEFNRGSFCYQPYLLYNYLAEQHGESCVDIFEDFTLAQLDDLPEAEMYYVALWSYPQIDACRAIKRFLPAKDSQLRFFGYTPLIEEVGLPAAVLTNTEIVVGMRWYPKYYNTFDHLLLSDCDMHLSKYEGQVYPMFTSYGCPNGCEFCPSTVNCNHSRISLDVGQVLSMLETCSANGIHNIHFTDEDFFFNADRTFEILKEAKRMCDHFRFIALGSAKAVLRYLAKYGAGTLGQMKLIEVGFETADPGLAKRMGKPPVDYCTSLAKVAVETALDIFWLTLTFFPGETLASLNQTGEFLRQYGYKPEELHGRIRTNSTEGGLGQFFQPYPGTKQYHNLPNLGVQIDDRPVRLLPSFLPHSFLDCYVDIKRIVTQDDMYWLNLYKVAVPPDICLADGTHKVGEIVRADTVEHMASDATAIAILARLGVL